MTFESAQGGVVEVDTQESEADMHFLLCMGSSGLLSAHLRAAIQSRCHHSIRMTYEGVSTMSRKLI